MAEIIIHYSGSAGRTTEIVLGGAEYSKVVFRDKKGIRVLFFGNKFSSEDFRKKMKGKKSCLD